MFIVPGLSVAIRITAYPPAGMAIVSLYGAPDWTRLGRFPPSHAGLDHVTSLQLAPDVVHRMSSLSPRYSLSLGSVREYPIFST